MRAFKILRSLGVFIFAMTVFLVMPTQQTHAGLLDRLFAPKAKLWAQWTAHVPDSALSIDHGLWDAFVRKNVVSGGDGINRIDYAHVSGPDRKSLEDYLSSMQSIRISDYSREQQFPFWVNLYNALTVDVVLRHYPVRSIRDIDLSKGLFAKGPWRAPAADIENTPVSLNDIEHRILRPIWRDPRIHYAVNCASIGCPNLMNRAFTADAAEEMLEQAARGYVNHPRGMRVEDGRLYVSSIYEWFRDDFGGNTAGVLAHLRRYADEPRALDQINRISGDDYDWTLNDLKSPIAAVTEP